MSDFDAYRDSFPNARLTRSKFGVLDGGTLIFNGHTHEQFVDLFHAIGSDRDNRVVILTGSGNAFTETISPEGFDFFTPQGYDKIYREGRKILMNILDIGAPLIAAVKGAARLHTEFILPADIVLATPSTVFQDKPHFDFGIVPGDGVNLLWPEVARPAAIARFGLSGCTPYCAPPPRPKFGRCALHAATIPGSICGKGLVACFSCSVPAMIGRMQSTASPIPILAPFASNPACLHSAVIWAQGPPAGD
jgi:hypothetical protein